MSLLKTFSWGSAAALVVGGANLFTSLYLFEFLTPSDFASFVVLSSLVSTTAAGAGGLQLAVARQISVGEVDHQYLDTPSRTLGREIVFALMSATLVWIVLTPLVSRLSTVPWILVLAAFLGLAAAAYTALIDGYFIGKGVVWRTSWAAMSATSVRLLFALFWPLLSLSGGLLAFAMPLVNVVSTRLFIRRKQLRYVMRQPAVGIQRLLFPTLFVMLLFGTLQLDLWFGASDRFEATAQADYAFASSLVKALLLLSLPLGLLLISQKAKRHGIQNQATMRVITLLGICSGSTAFVIGLAGYLLIPQDSVRWGSVALVVMFMSPGVATWSAAMARLQPTASESGLVSLVQLAAFSTVYIAALLLVQTSQTLVAATFSMGGATLLAGTIISQVRKAAGRTALQSLKWKPRG